MNVFYWRNVLAERKFCCPFLSCSRDHANQEKSYLLVAYFFNFGRKCLRLLVDTAKLLVTPDINSDVWSYNFCNWALESYVMWNDNERRRDRVEWGGVSKRVWVATLLSPFVVQFSLLRRYHHLEHLITPCSWMLLSGAKRHPQINGQQARVSSKFYCCSFYSYPISYLSIVNKFKWPSLIFWLVYWPVLSTIANRAWEGTEKKLHICAEFRFVCLQGEHVEKRK